MHKQGKMKKESLLLVFAVSSLSAAGCLTSPPPATDSDAQHLSAKECSAAASWSAGTRYAVGALVRYDGSLYQCLQAHTSQADWTPKAVPALWSPRMCEGGNPGSGDPGNGGGGDPSHCDRNAWVYMGNNPRACAGHLGESCGWTQNNLGQGYHCQSLSWGIACAPGGATCSPQDPGDGDSGDGDHNGGGGSPGDGDSGDPGDPGGPGGGTGKPANLMFGPYKDTSINMDWNKNQLSTSVSGTRAPFTSDFAGAGGKTVTLAFATGECGSENWGGVPGAAMAAANASMLAGAGIDYVLSTGGAAGAFSCGSDAGMSAFIDRWASPHLVGVDFDIEAGQSPAVVSDLIRRMKTAHARYPNLRFTLTLATLAPGRAGANTAQSLGASAPDGFNAQGSGVMEAVKTLLGFNGQASTWPGYLTVNLMTMDYGAPGPYICVVSNGLCQMGQSAIQAAFNLHDHWGVPFANIELTPMIGGNDVQSEHFTLADVDTVSHFAIQKGLGGVHYWSYDRDVDCPEGAASPTCNSLGGVGARGFLKRFLAAGLR